MTTQATLPFVKRTLDNGLDVIVHEDHHVPIVAVNIWYHVGSKNERPGRTGFAHLFEHLMFEGSQHHNSGYFPPLQQAGALLNGSTNADRTNYWEVVPKTALDLALWMESDRMGYLLPALTQQRFDTQRDVVLNERRQNYENRPYGFAMMALTEALFHDEHPYHWMTIGSADDIRAMKLDEVRDFFRTYYHPANASLTLAGDIEAARAFDLAEHYFGELEAGARPQPLRVAGDLERESRLVLEDRVELPRVYMAWHSPAMFDDGDAEMDLLADLLANGKTSRLYRTLVYEQQVALDVSAYQSSRELAGFFLVVVDGRPGAIAHGYYDGHRHRAAAGGRRGTIRRRDGTGAGADGSPLHVPDSDRRRIRRQVRSAQRLQRVLRRSRVLCHRSGALPEKRRPTGVGSAARRHLRLRSARHPERRPARASASLALPGSEPVAVS